MPLRVAIETLGCKVNQFESSCFLEALRSEQYEPVSFRDHADLYLVHGCAVTAKAASQSRQLLRRARRLNPEAAVVAAGCHAQYEADVIVREELATHIIGNTEKFDLTAHIRFPATFTNPYQAVADPRGSSVFRVGRLTGRHGGRTRAFLKIQDGCDAFCSYCIVPFLRGGCRSMTPDFVVQQLRDFACSGYREVVLSGIHLGQWGKDFSPPQGLPGLLKTLDRQRLPIRVRLSSIEPTECTDELIQLFQQCDWLCPHFHVPMQSGDAQILAAMKRPYLPEQYRELILRLHRIFPRAALGADVLVGFPGETESRFERTHQLIEELPLTYLHAFPFSPRRGTDAALLPDRVSTTELRRRVRTLRDLSARKRAAFQEKLKGQSLEVLVESRIPGGWWRGTSENYLQVLLPARKGLVSGSMARVELTERAGHDLIGRVLAIVG